MYFYRVKFETNGVVANLKSAIHKDFDEEKYGRDLEKRLGI